MFLACQIIDLPADVTSNTADRQLHQKVHEVIEYKGAFAMHTHAFMRARCLSHDPQFKIDWRAEFSFTLSLLSLFKFDRPDVI